MVYGKVSTSQCINETVKSTDDNATTYCNKWITLEKDMYTVVDDGIKYYTDNFHKTSQQDLKNIYNICQLSYNGNKSLCDSSTVDPSWQWLTSYCETDWFKHY